MAHVQARDRFERHFLSLARLLVVRAAAIFQRKLLIFINTALQRGDRRNVEPGNRLNGFASRKLEITWLKPGVNETNRAVLQDRSGIYHEQTPAKIVQISPCAFWELSLIKPPFLPAPDCWGAF